MRRQGTGFNVIFQVIFPQCDIFEVKVLWQIYSHLMLAEIKRRMAAMSQIHSVFLELHTTDNLNEQFSTPAGD